MTEIIIICIMVGLLYIAISFILYSFKKYLCDLEFSILILEKRIGKLERIIKKNGKN